MCYVKTKDIFYSNSIEEMEEIKRALENADIDFEIVFNENAHPVFGTNLSVGMQNILYKYVIKVSETDEEKTIKILDATFKEDVSVEEDNDKEAAFIGEAHDIKERTEISVSLILLLIFQHYSRFFAHVSKNIKTKKTKVILCISGLTFWFFYMLAAVLYMSNTIDEGVLFCSLVVFILFLIYEFILNIVDFIIEKQMLQLICYLISLGILFAIAVTVFLVITFS